MKMEGHEPSLFMFHASMFHVSFPPLAIGEDCTYNPSPYGREYNL